MPLEPRHLLHSALTCPLSVNEWRLKSRHPFVLATQLISSPDNNNIYAAHWVHHQWNVEWLDNLMRLHTVIPDTGTYSPRMALARTVWVRINCLCISVRCFRSSLHKCGMASSVACECGPEEQTVNHIVLQCPTHRHPHGLHGLTVLDNEKIKWLLNTCPKI